MTIPQYVRKILVLIVLIASGLFTKAYSGFGNAFVNNYLGGVIYVIFFIILASLIFPNANPVKISLVVFCVTGLIEFSQLIQTDFLINIRKHFLLKLLLGSSFNVFDFIFYFFGSISGYWFIVMLKNKT